MRGRGKNQACGNLENKFEMVCTRCCFVRSRIAFHENHTDNVFWALYKRRPVHQVSDADIRSLL